MLFHPIRPATAWALLCMEAALALVPAALMATPLLVLLLPLAFVLRGNLRPRLPGGAAPPWTPRLMAIGYQWAGLALATCVWGLSNLGSLTAGQVQLGRLLLWALTGVLPVLLGLVLWWRGGVLARSEVGATDVRTEFVILGGVALGVLVAMRGMISPPAGLLAGAALAFVLSGLLALSLARQDAAEAQRTGGARTLAGLSAAAPTAAGLLLAVVLTPALVAAMWAAFGALIQILLAPFLVLAQWLASLLPRLGPPAGLPPDLFDRQPLPDLSQLQRQPGPPVWLAWLILGLFVLMAVALVIVVARLLLAWSMARRQPEDWPDDKDVRTEPAGSPTTDARALLSWLLAWLRRRLFGRPAASGHGPAFGQSAAVDDDARAAYRSLLAWARAQGLPRRAAETTQQFRRRLVDHAPEATSTLGLVTEVYESDRYGERRPTRQALAAVRRQLDELMRRQSPGA